MSDTEADKKPAKKAVTVEDRGESPTAMEPLLIREGGKKRAELADMALELASISAKFRGSLRDEVANALADLVRSMNCYYSNLIEGHDTHPIDIERALNNDYSADPKKRDLQLEAKAHICVQKWIDENGLQGRATTSDGIREVHRRFCELLPDELLWVENPETHERVPVIPGEWRTNDVAVGGHVAISPGAIPNFMRRFEEGYTRLGKIDSIVAAATAHHRLLWVHPFADGNGRVARLMSYSMLRDALDTGGIWSIARGLARSEKEYKVHLANCDLTRRNGLDGRGNLSEEMLAEFAMFFLQICIDQVKFMESLVEPSKLRERILLWTEEETRAGTLPPKSGVVLEQILYRGEVPRGDIDKMLDSSERSARRITSALIDRGVVTSESSRSPLRLAFPATLASRWMPGLFPDQRARDS